MKIIMAQSTVRTGNEQSAELNIVLCDAFNLDNPITEYDDVVLTTEFENFSVTLDDDKNYVFELNDECVLKCMRLYVKAAKVLAPFIKPIMGLMNMLKDEYAEIEAFIGKRK